jgi:Uma2 family endonuclease
MATTKATIARRPISRASRLVLPGADAAQPTVSIPADAWTHAGFRAWATSGDFPEQGRISYLGGEVWIDMSPEIIETHTLIKSEVGYRIVGLNRKEKRGLFLGDRVLLTNEDVGLSTEADSAFVTWETLRSGRLELVPRRGHPGQSREVRGTPDWVLEILSDSSVVKDTQRLRDLYFRAGIPEYWLIDARAEQLVFQVLVPGPDGYVDSPHRGQWHVSSVFDRRFRLERQRGPLGIWEYTLHQKPK